jgi:hypothetical protein
MRSYHLPGSLVTSPLSCSGWLATFLVAVLLTSFVVRGVHGDAQTVIRKARATTTTTTTTLATVANDDDDDGGFYYGTQSLHCLAGFVISRRTGVYRRSADDDHPRRGSTDGDPPRRSDFLYIHRLLRYRGRVFEWGGGSRGYHVGPTESVLDCPVTWESQPAGQSACPADRLVAWTAGYRRRYGAYNLLSNNCHQFANRAVAFLLHGCDTSPSSSNTSPLSSGHQDPGGPSHAMKAASSVVNWIISKFVAANDGEQNGENVE